MLLAKALFDNVAETTEELAFRRGDILSVLEQDCSGLDGWWLCSLKGRRGIVPGNRLRILDSITAQKEAAVMKTKNPADQQTAVWHKPDKVVTPQRTGNMFVYNKPPSQQSTDSSFTDYDVPTSKQPTRLPQQDTDTDYDHPTNNQPIRKVIPLDSIQLQLQMASLDQYNVPGSNRSSTVSILSTGSNLSGLSSLSGLHSSVCESERSSLDLSGHETYDVPPAARPLPNINKSTMDKSPRATRKQETSSPVTMIGDYDSLKNSCGVYDSPKRLLTADELTTYDTPRPAKPVSRNCSGDFYDTPLPAKPVSRNCSGDSGISLTLKNQVCDSSKNYDSTALHTVAVMSKVSESGESDYDTPKPSKHISQVQQVTSSKEVLSEPKLLRGGSSKASPEESTNIYDIPPCVTRDTDKTSSINSCDNTQHFLELNSAMEALMTLQHSLNASCSKLLGFIHPAWRTPEFLEPNAYCIKVAANGVHTAGESFLKFGRGALENALQTGDTVLIKKLRAAVDMLSGSLEMFSDSLQSLNKNMWPLVTLVRHVSTVVEAPDNLDKLIKSAQEMPDRVRSISCLIQGNSIHLFKRSSSAGNTQEGAPTQTSTPKPKSKAPPPPVKPKPRMSVGSQGEITPLPKFTQKNSIDSNIKLPDKGHVYSEPQPFSSPDSAQTPASAQTSSQQQRQSAVEDSDYDVPKPLAKPVEQAPPFTTDHNIMEYDYVSLTKSMKDQNIESGKQEVEIRQKLDDAQMEVHGRSRPVQSLFPPPDVRTSGLSANFKCKLDELQKEAEEPVKIYSDDYDVPQPQRESTPPTATAPVVALLEANDVKLLQFYAMEIKTHEAILVNSIEVFMKCIDEQQSPKAFIACSKFVILAAHKMVYIGDTLTRNITSEVVRNSVMNCAYNLCEVLKMTINATKKAALDFPQVKSVQEMVDKVSEVSVNAANLKQTVRQYAS